MKTLPITVKRSVELLGLCLIALIVAQGSMVIMPLIMAFFFSLLLMPPFRFFRKLKVPEALAIFLPIFLLTIVTIVVIWLFSDRVAVLLSDLAQIERNVALHIDHLSMWISRSFGFTPKDQLKFISEQSNKFFSGLQGLIKSALGSLTDAIIFFGLLPVYIYLVMFYRNIFLKFIVLWFAAGEQPKVAASIRQIEKMVKHYLVGLAIQIAYITVLLGGLLAVFGIENALLIGLLFAFLNLIPYLGALIGNILAVIITLASSENLTDILIVLGAITVVQFLDNNILMPRIVGGQVKINALVSIVGIIAGGAIAGISGMFLAMPILSILKVIFDSSDKYRQWGVILGADRPKESPLKLISEQSDKQTEAGL
ncbi:MAG: AI-2E family transporter [Bacteroidetes bacterium]|nr:AI-2E family transporter [Bacteroidota bacterium]